MGQWDKWDKWDMGQEIELRITNFPPTLFQISNLKSQIMKAHSDRRDRIMNYEYEFPADFISNFKFETSNTESAADSGNRITNLDFETVGQESKNAGRGV